MKIDLISRFLLPLQARLYITYLSLNLLPLILANIRQHKQAI